MPKTVQASRAGKRHVGAYIEIPRAGALKMVTLARGTLIQTIVIEGIERWLKNEGLPCLADLPDSPEVAAVLARFQPKNQGERADTGNTLSHGDHRPAGRGTSPG